MSEIQLQESKEEVKPLYSEAATDQETEPQQVQPDDVPFHFDFWNEVQCGHFQVVLAIPNLPLNQLDQNGFGLIHYAVTYKQIQIIQKLVELGCKIDLLSKFNQTPFVIACNYGFIEICKYLYDHGANINTKDNYNFTPMLYTLKMKHYALTLWLLCKGSQYQNLADSNGCSAVHWAAYENDIFLLRFIKTIGMDIDLLDLQGYTPLVRACHNYSYKAIHFLCDNYPDMLVYGAPLGESRSLPAYIRRQIRSETLKKSPVLSGIMGFFAKSHHTILSGLYLLLSIMIIYSVTFAEEFYQFTESQFWFIVSIVYVLSVIYFTLCSFWFINRTSDTPDQGRKLVQRKKTDPVPQQQDQITIGEEEKESQPLNVDPQPQENQWVSARKQFSWYSDGLTPDFLKRITFRSFWTSGVDYKPVENLLDSMVNKPPDYLRFADKIQEHQAEIEEILDLNDPLWYESFTIIHLVYFLMETKRFVAINTIDWQRVCPTCLQYKPPRTVHCQFSKKCVRDYHFYSRFFRKSINATNHLLYFAFLTLQIMIYGSYLFFIWNFKAAKTESWFFLFPIEVIYLMYKDEGLNQGVFIAFIQITQIYLCVQWLVEVYCIIQNITYNELMNSQRYRYLHSAEQIKNGSVYLLWRPRLENGMMYNILMYIGHQIKHLVIV